MKIDELDQLAEKYVQEWIRTQNVSINDLPDGWYESREIIQYHPEKAVQLISALLHSSQKISDENLRMKWICNIAAGEFEDLFAEHGEIILDEIIREMRKDDLFLLAATGVWPRGRDRNNATWTTFQSELQACLRSRPQVHPLQ